MTPANPRWGREQADPTELPRVRSFLQRWYFSISEDGTLYARPQQDEIAIDDLHQFMDRLALLWDAAFPLLVVFDFTDSRPFNATWTDLREICEHATARLGAEVREVLFTHSDSRLLLIARSAPLPETLLASWPAAAEAPETFPA